MSTSNPDSREPVDAEHQPRVTTVVDRDVQFGVVRKIATHWIALFACNSLALLLWVRLFEQPDLAWKETLADCVRRFLPFLVITACLIPAFVLDTLKLTNRFAGPVSRLRREITHAAEGRPVAKLTFRSNDYWREIADGFNELTRRAGLQVSDKAPNDPSSAS
ncbi:MAG: hypothetical protein AAF670_19655 [Planctomycetota bacterium]